MRILIATHNPSKFQRYYQLLESIPDIEPVSLIDLGITEKVDEPFETARENAEHKARAYAKLSGIPTLSIDEAVTTNFLPENEQPGVYVRRFADKHHEMTDDEALMVWRNIIDSSPVTDKAFIWDYSIVLYHPKYNRAHYTKAVNHTRIAEVFSTNRLKGYPMSSFMIYQGSSKPNADESADERKANDRTIFSTFLTDMASWAKQYSS